MGCRGPVYGPALRGQCRDTEARWRKVSSFKWLEMLITLSAHVTALHWLISTVSCSSCQLLSVPVLDAEQGSVCAVPGSVRHGSERDSTCLPLSSAPSVEEVEGEGRQCQAPEQAVSLPLQGWLPAVQVTLWVQHGSGCRPSASF